MGTRGKFIVAVKPRSGSEVLMGRAAVQTDLDRLEKQAGWQLQDTSAGKCQV